MVEFFIGYLSRAIHEERELRPLPTLREERMATVRYGFNAKTHFNIIDIVRSQLNFARKGLSDLGINVGFLDILDKRLENRVSPGDNALIYGAKNSTGQLTKLYTKSYLISGRGLRKINLSPDINNNSFVDKSVVDV